MFHDIYLKTIAAYIENHIKDPLDASKLASIVGYDADYFRSVFKSGTGDSIARYVRNRKLNHAAFILRNSSRSVSDIALDFGFSSHDSFTRAFKRLVGYSPSEFRCSDMIIKGMRITPGHMGPVIVTEETNHMTKQLDKDDSTILYGVPKVSFFNNPPELTPLISSLRSCLTYSGQSISYAKLMAGSGAAFRLMWNTTCWDGGNVDILCMHEDPFVPISKAFSTANRELKLVGRTKKAGNKGDMIALVKSEIDAGRPVIAFGIIGPPEACVVTGYRDDGKTLLGWNFFQDFPEWQGGVEFESCGYFIRQGWYEHSESKGVLAIGELHDKKDEMLFLKDTLTFALEVMEKAKVRKRACGAMAFDAWRDKLLDEKEFPENIPLPMLMERLMCHSDAFTMVAEGRHNASVYFSEEADKLPKFYKELIELSKIFKSSHDTACKMAKYVPLGIGENQAKALAIRVNREGLAKIIDECKKLELIAIEKMHELLARL